MGSEKGAEGTEPLVNCENGGTCEDRLGDFRCICDEEFTGIFCERRKNFLSLYMGVYLADIHYFMDFCKPFHYQLTKSFQPRQGSYKWESLIQPSLNSLQ